MVKADLQVTAEDGEMRRHYTGEELYLILRQDLINDRTPGGAVLQENEIAARYGVSRTPVREALQRLHQDNLIGRKGRFYTVVQPPVERIRELYEFREAIEASTIVLCCRRASDEELEHICKIVDDQQEAVFQKRFYDYERLDALFHVGIANGANNCLLTHQLEVSYDQIWFSKVGNLVSLQEYSVDETIAEHRRIVDALIRRKEDVAKAEMISHLRAAIDVSERSAGPRRGKKRL
ncbi:GntR family transcriptional regulator [Acetobacter fallax]|uniref:FCD domain-containing protein n=2 Tax=Acetobacter fallax TaxID=1737473 RepID=A0ABX0KBE6_9PROT|nr:GntR family transcriptional regulator [Acetobacter fallax]NHO33481.1 FCD domain-containing protein [Acetobacter fallax]NHO37111.1 FCD domain-containing protein [Acetobacter fallax]